MTNEEAIYTLANFKRYISGGGVIDRQANRAIDMAIEALSAEVRTQMSLADCISRQDAIAIATQEGAYGYISAEELAEMPSAEPEIIRCKDCIYYHPSFCEIWSKFGTVQTREKGYCYMAERREDELRERMRS